MSNIFFPEPVQNGRKRSHPIESVPYFEDPLYPSLKRSNVHYPELFEAPSTPESGIDISELSNQSPNFYSSPREVHEGVMEATSLQPEQSKDGYMLMIADEPEENYRARYESEGCRGPMKGRNGGCPTVEVSSAYTKCLGGTMKVELTSSDGTPLQSCQLDSVENDSNLIKNITPGQKITFDNLRIRRLKKQASSVYSKSSSVTSRGVSGAKGGAKGYSRGKQDEKMAHLLFTAHIKTPNGTNIVLKALSQAIYLNASHEPPEIHRVVPQYGCSGDIVAIIGTRMHSPRVSFILNIHGKDEEIQAEIDKDVSHQNALVIKVPQIPLPAFANNSAPAFIRVTAGKGDRSGKEPLKSHKIPFTCIHGVCKECWISQCYPSSYSSFKNFPMTYYPTPTTVLQPPKQKMAAIIPVIVPSTSQARSNSPNVSVDSPPSHMTSSPPPLPGIPLNSVDNFLPKNASNDFISYQQQPEHSPSSMTGPSMTGPSDQMLLSTWTETSQSGQPSSPCTPLMTPASCTALDVPPSVLIQVQANAGTSRNGGDTLPGPEEFEKYLGTNADAMRLLPHPPPPPVTSLPSTHPHYHSNAYYSQQPNSGVFVTRSCS